MLDTLRNRLQFRGIQLYRYGLNAVTPAVSELSVKDCTATFHTRTPAETHDIHNPSRGELPLVADFLEEVRSDDIVYDVGASAGLYTVFCGLATDASVHAFDPVPGNVGRLRENMQLNGVTATVHPVAVGDFDGEVHLSTAGKLSHGTPAVTDEPGTDTVSAEQRTLDSLVEEGVAPPDVLKLDVEGHEREVIDGMTRLLNERPPRAMYVELHAGVDRTAVENDLHDAGYDCEVVHERSRESFLEATQ